MMVHSDYLPIQQRQEGRWPSLDTPLSDPRIGEVVARREVPDGEMWLVCYDPRGRWHVYLQPTAGDPQRGVTFSGTRYLAMRVLAGEAEPS